MIRGFLLLFGMALVAGAAVEQPSTPIILGPEAAAKEGRALAAQMLSEPPPQSFTNTGVLKVRDAHGKRTEAPLRVRVFTGETNWTSWYDAGTNRFFFLSVKHNGTASNEYKYFLADHPAEASGAMVPFAGSDFWLADLGLEFLHWPEQRLLRKEIRRGQSCSVLESVNPQPAPGAYSRVVSWIDIDTGGIINAEAYDSKGKLLKEFAVTSLKKVRGQMELKGMEIENRQTGSRTTFEFDLGDGK